MFMETFHVSVDRKQAVTGLSKCLVMYHKVRCALRYIQPQHCLLALGDQTGCSCRVHTDLYREAPVLALRTYAVTALGQQRLNLR